MSMRYLLFASADAFTASGALSIYITPHHYPAYWNPRIELYGHYNVASSDSAMTRPHEHAWTGGGTMPRMVQGHPRAGRLRPKIPE
jgi:hypothetical protein